MEERLQKIISAAGITSRRAAEEFIREGRVRVNGKVITELGAKADPDRDHIKVDGKLINPRQPKTYLMLNKPAGFVTTLSDPEGRPTVAALLKGIRIRVYPVGRLDYDTEGLLLLTNDGDFAFRVTHPRHELPKSYLVKVKGVIDDRQIENLEKGVFLQDGKTAPARVKKMGKEESNSWIEITIHEGRKRQVRRMIDHTGHSVIKLKRVRIGELHLGDLPPGMFRHLTADEVNSLREQAQVGEGTAAGAATSPGRRPAAAAHMPVFIEGPKPGRRPAKRKQIPDPVGAGTREGAPGAHPRGRHQADRGRTFQRETRRPGRRSEAPADRNAQQGEQRFVRTSGRGKGRPVKSGGPQSGGAFAFHKNRKRPFGDRGHSPDRADRRPTGGKPWNTDRRPFGSAGSRPDDRRGRPGGFGPRTDVRTGQQRMERSGRPAGPDRYRDSQKKAAANGPRKRPHGPRRTGPRRTGGFKGRPKGAGGRRS